jgi:Septum formation
MPPQQPPAKKRPNFAPLIVLIVVVGVIAGAFFLFRDQLAGDVFDLKVGDCIDLPTTDEAVSQVQHQPCTSVHDAEIFLNLTDPTAAGQPFPGSDQFRSQVIAQCVPAATQYMGTSFEARTDLDVGWFRPTEDSWDQKNDRVITCYLYKVDATKLSTPLKSSGAQPS